MEQNRRLLSPQIKMTASAAASGHRLTCDYWNSFRPQKTEMTDKFQFYAIKFVTLNT